VPGNHTIFVCGNDADAKGTVVDMLAGFGWPTGAVVDLGDITAARGAEMYLALWLRMMQATGSARFNIKLVTG
jgi:predicted dinucleotide-binding enzyme